MLLRISILLFLFVFTGCDKFESLSASSTVSIDGSSTVYPILESGLNEFRENRSAETINIEYSGTGQGFFKLCNGNIDIAAASREITVKEQQLCKSNDVEYIKLPIALDGIAVVVNAQSYWVDYLTTSELRQLWRAVSEGSVEYWSDIREGWPQQKINLYGPGSASGTYSYFANVIVEATTTRGDYMATEDDEMMAEAISADPQGLAFFGLGYYNGQNYSLKLVPIDDENPENVAGPIIPSRESVKSGTYQPLSRQLYLYVSKQSLSKNTVSELLNFLMQRAASIVNEAGYIPQQDNVYTNNISVIKSQL